MNAVEDMKDKCFQFLRRLYEWTDGDESRGRYMYGIGEDLGFDRDLTVKIEQYLRGEGLINSTHVFGTEDKYIRILHKGVLAVWGDLPNLDRPTDHPSSQNITSIGQMINSQIQIGSPEATQVATFNENRYDELKEVIESLKESIDQLGIDQQQKSKLQANIKAMEAQTSSPNPKPTIITECLGSIKRILESATGSVLASGLLIKIIALSGGS
jgi:hypothetical protein